MERPLQCVWMLAGVLDYHLCDREYRCEDCPLDLALRRTPRPMANASGAVAGGPCPLEREPRSAPPRGAVAGFELPEGVFYAPWHVWARIEGGGCVRVGVDDFAQRLLGRIYAVELPRRGARVHRRTANWRVAHPAGEIVLRVPVTGVVREVNERLLAEPSLPNRDPYGYGAALVIEPTHLCESVRSLFWGEEARNWCQAEASRLQDELLRLRPPPSGLGATLQDGGTVTKDLAAILDPGEICLLIRSFLSDPADLEKNKR